MSPWPQLPAGGNSSCPTPFLCSGERRKKQENGEKQRQRSGEREAERNRCSEAMKTRSSQGKTELQVGLGHWRPWGDEAHLLPRASLLTPSSPAHGSFLPVPRSCAPAAGSALETWGGEPPSHHPCQRHLRHTSPMSQQPHAPDQEPAGAAQWQCQRSLYSLCKSPFQVLRKEGGWGGATQTWSGGTGLGRECLELAGENGEGFGFNRAQTPTASEPPPLPQPRLRQEAPFPRCPVRSGA